MNYTHTHTHIHIYIYIYIYAYKITLKDMSYCKAVKLQRNTYIKKKTWSTPFTTQILLVLNKNKIYRGYIFWFEFTKH